MFVKRFVNSIFNSNSYIIYSEETETWVIDPGDSKQILDWLNNNNKILKGILITHSHFDHIYGINDLQEKFPDAKMHASFYAKEGMMSDKLNGSLYHEKPYVIEQQEVYIIKDGDRIKLWKDVFLDSIETPGHNRDCMSFHVQNNLFTGDALIPGIKVVTKIKYGDKIQAANSIKRIFELFNDETLIWPGHKDNCLLGTLRYGNLNIQL